jgi:hypothetical protein
MDALATLQYLPIMVVFAAALAAALVGGAILARLGSLRPPPKPDAPAPGGAPVLPNVMLLLAGLSLGVGLLLLLPAMMILRYFPSWQVDAILIVGAAILAAPALYLWRARSF